MSSNALTIALGIKTGSKVSVINPPPGFVSKLNPLPDGVEFLITAVTGLDVILFFTRDPTELVARLPALSRAMAVRGGIWVCWPEGEERCRVSEDFVRLTALDIGLIDDKHWNLDGTWKGLRLVWKPPSERPEPPKKKRVQATA
jgi:hypothetical protein